MSQRTYREYSITVLPNAEVHLDLTGVFWRILSASADFRLAIGDQAPAYAAAGLSFEAVDPFDKLRVINDLAEPLTVTIAVGQGGRLTDDRASIAGAIEVSRVSEPVAVQPVQSVGAPRVWTQPDVALSPNVLTHVVATRAGRRDVVVQSLLTSAANVRVGDGGVSANQGHELQPGGSVVLSTDYAIHAMAIGGAATLSVVEVGP